MPFWKHDESPLKGRCHDICERFLNFYFFSSHNYIPDIWPLHCTKLFLLKSLCQSVHDFYKVASLLMVVVIIVLILNELFFWRAFLKNLDIKIKKGWKTKVLITRDSCFIRRRELRDKTMAYKVMNILNYDTQNHLCR